MTDIIKVLDHGYVKLLNMSGPVRRPAKLYDADDADPAIAARMSFNQSDKTRTRGDDLRLCQFLMREHHDVPFEHIVVWFEMYLPIFVARHLVRHRTASISELSSRYKDLQPHWYIPKHVSLKPDNAKQGRGGRADPIIESKFLTELDNACKHGYEQYQYAMRHHVATEQARLFLHVNHYTKWIYKMDLRNLMHLFDLRCNENTEYETRIYAETMRALVEGRLPELLGFREGSP